MPSKLSELVEPLLPLLGDLLNVRVPDFPDEDWSFPDFDLPLSLSGVVSDRISPGYWHLQTYASVKGLE